ncbi:sigma factor [Achromobacter xylosoxidans]
MSRNPLLASEQAAAPADAQAENGGAIAKAYARWRLPLLRGLARFKGSVGSAEDVLHDGVVKWVAANPALDSSEEQGAYLRKTVMNGVADEFRERRAGRRLQTVSLDEAARDGQAGRPTMRHVPCARRLASSGWSDWLKRCGNCRSASARPSC